MRSVSALHKIWLERFAICRASTNTLIRVKDHNTLKSNVLNILEMREELPNELESHSGKVHLYITSRLQ